VFSNQPALCQETLKSCFKHHTAKQVFLIQKIKVPTTITFLVVIIAQLNTADESSVLLKIANQFIRFCVYF
jgi:hypothetical protein